VPHWFFSASIILEILFAFAALFVTIYAHKVALIYGQREIKLMAVGFLLISLSYFSKAFINIFLLNEIKEGVFALSLSSLNNIAASGFYIYLSLYLIGAALLSYITFKTRNINVLLLLLALSGVSLWLSVDKTLVFSIISSLFFCILSIHYGNEYFHNKNKRTLLIFLGFAGLLLSGLGFAGATNYYINFVVSHILELASYILILAGIISPITTRK
jgi:hypothetical protein